MSETDDFPDVSLALEEPNGLLAVGGDLSLHRLITAYQNGIFPWFNADQPILWWSPNPRAVIFLDNFKITRSLQKILRHQAFEITIDQNFEQVIKACASPRPKQKETWISTDMVAAYCALHQAGYAHSIEVWRDHQLIGGLYGVDCGGIFAGESMFSFESNGSKIALVTLVNHLKKFDYQLIDCQFNNPFLQQFGSCDIPRAEFIKLLRACKSSSSNTALCAWSK
jgi:leucyl/phenylalanyl-tRNA--protein transferase